MKRWSKNEEQLLINSYPKLGPRILQLLKKYSKAAIYRKANKLKLNVDKSVHNYRISEARRGHNVSKEQKRSISRTLKQKYSSGEIKVHVENRRRLNKMEETNRRKKIGETLKQKHASGEITITEKQRRSASDHMKQNNPMHDLIYRSIAIPKARAAAKQRTGPDHPRWNPNVNQNKRRLKSEEWERRRLEVYSRDNYVCQKCGTKCVSKNKATSVTIHRVIQCHHIIPWEISHDDSLSNLTTLCLSCHNMAEAELRRSDSLSDLQIQFLTRNGEIQYLA